MKLGGDARKLSVQLGAEAVDDRDDSNRDAGRDKAILDGGCPRAVLQKVQKKLFHG